MRETIYSDTKEGVLSFLRKETHITLPESDENIFATPDPCIEGVWKVDIDSRINDEHDVILVYLAGYKNSWGKIRTYNDWE